MIRPRGWIARQLRLLADGLTGRLGEVWEDVGPSSGWLGGDGEAWERGPYYVRGLVALAHVLGDEALVRTAGPWIEWALASQRDDGFFGPAANDDWWARMPMTDALCLHHEATGDGRVPPMLARYLDHMGRALPSRPLDGWARARGGEGMGHALWLHQRTGDEKLLRLADLLHAQTIDWTTELRADAPSDAFELAHGVNRAMGLKLPALLARRTGDRDLLAVVRRGFERTLARHGQIQGTFSCDEMLHGRGPTQGTELCSVVELLHTFLTVLETAGEAWVGDAIERLAYNALPPMLGPDACTRQYFAQANQVACTPGPHGFWYHHDTDLLFGIETGYGCCTANLHLGWPTVVRSLWLATPDRGLVATLFGPCEVVTTVGDGARLRLVEETGYPFDERVWMALGLDRPAAFPLGLRIPAWAVTATVTVNGDVAWQGGGGIVAMLRRTWCDGDVVEVHLPMTVCVTPWDAGVAVARGPLVYGLPIGERWRAVGGTPPFADYELHPASAWNYGIVMSEMPKARVETAAVGDAPWTSDRAPARIALSGGRIPEWGLVEGSAGPLPVAARASSGAPETVTLVPFGSTRLRVAVFPALR